MMTADDYRSGSISAAFGGNTTIIPFAAQAAGQPIDDVLRVYDERAELSVLDFSYHLIVTDTGIDGFREQILAAFERGVTSFKVFLTYGIALTDEEFLDVLEVAREAGRGEAVLDLIHVGSGWGLYRVAEHLGVHPDAADAVYRPPANQVFRWKVYAVAAALALLLLGAFLLGKYG